MLAERFQKRQCIGGCCGGRDDERSFELDGDVDSSTRDCSRKIILQSSVPLNFFACRPCFLLPVGRKPRAKYLWIRISDLESLRVCSEETGVDGIYHWRSSDHPAAKVATVKALDCVLASLHLVKLEIDIAFRVGLDGDVDDVAVFVLRLLTNILL